MLSKHRDGQSRRRLARNAVVILGRPLKVGVAVTNPQVDPAFAHGSVCRFRGSVFSCCRNSNCTLRWPAIAWRDCRVSRFPAEWNRRLRRRGGYHVTPRLCGVDRCGALADDGLLWIAVLRASRGARRRGLVTDLLSPALLWSGRRCGSGARAGV